MNFLRARLKQTSRDVTNVVQTVPLQPESLSRSDQMYDLLEIIVESISGQSDLTFDGIVANLEAKSLLKANDRAHFSTHQLVFIITGIITMLYQPFLQPEIDKFVIVAGTTERHRPPRNATWTKHYLERTEITEHLPY